MDIQRKSLPEQHYLYVERTSALSGEAIGAAMVSGFSEIMTFTAQKGIAPLSAPIALYVEMPSGGQMAFRAGVFVSASDAKRAEGSVKAGAIAAGDAYMATHVGPYMSLNQTHRAMHEQLTAQGMAQAMPVWEVYVDDPQTTPEATLRTEIYRGAGA